MSYNKTILIVEDEAAILYALQSKLRVSGFKVLTADDGEKALNILHDTIPDAIILDIILPKVDGMEVLKQVKADARLKDVPTIIVTNLTDHETKKKGLELGAHDYLIKVEYNLDEIAERIAKAVA